MLEIKKDIVLIANYWHFEQEKASSRYRSFANILCEKYDLEVITSTFYHSTKKQRKIESLNIENLPYKMTMCYEKGYRKNISIRRIISYRQFGKSVLKYIKKREKPDLIIVSIPSLAVADYVTRYANRNNIPVILDIQDLWPEAFKMALSIPILSDILFYPMKKQADRIYARADKIMAVSDTYVARGLKCNDKDATGLSIYIGSDSKLIAEKTRDVEVNKPQDEFWIGYVGALGHSYDINTVSKAIKMLADKGLTNIVFKIMGDGPLRKEFEEFANRLNVKADFMGFVEYGTMMATLSKCDVAVNPIVGKSVSSIINKVSDYAMCGMAVVNTQNSHEYRKLINEYQAGINAENGSAESVASAILQLYQDRDLLLQIQRNSKRLGDEKFDRNITYLRIFDVIDKQGVL